MLIASGAHTIGRAHCDSVMDRLYPVQDPLMSDAMASELRAACPPVSGSDSTMLNLDATTPDRFDNTYYSNLVNKRGLLHSDQVRASTMATCMP